MSNNELDRPAPAPAAEISPTFEARLVTAQDSAITPAQADEVFAAGIDIGRLEAMDFVATIATSSMLAVFENIKKSKAWRHLHNPQSGDGRHFSSLEEFCEVKFGKSYRRLRELSSNRNAIGQEAFEQAERIGLRQVDYNTIKALPAPKQELIKEALEEGATKEDLQRALRELAAADQKEIESLTARAEKAEEAAESAEAQVARKDSKINELDRKLNARKVVAYTDWPEAFKGLIAQAQQAKRELLNAVDALAVIRQDAMQVQAESPAEEEVLGRAWIALADEMQDIFAIAGGKLEKEAQVFDNTLQAVADDHREGSK
ncbi:hypothetical protein [Brachymonas chironomi]|uniref:hypothetical protein n=1 Tax=Brachymonas chironomi TaxID=491919 RepID=UPI0012E9DDFA|nr:hypothetical protein [Brachymonas chironomi]